MSEHIFESYLMAGFECSSQRRRDGRRMDMIDATSHDKFAEFDYVRLARIGMKTCREGLRWHLIEKEKGKYDFSSASRQIEAAEKTGVQVIWDLFHYGYPDDIDIFGAEFPSRFADFAAAFTKFYTSRTSRTPIVVPVNEISFFSWIAGDIGHFSPFTMDRGDELKKQLALASIAAIQAVKSVAPEARIVATEPGVYVTAREEDTENADAAESYRLSQYQAYDMLCGRLNPELGGRPEYLDIIGVNYYPHNQWYYPDREMIALDDPLYRPLSEIIIEIYERYQRPMFIAETGTEGDMRPAWFRYVAGECERAVAQGADLHGICLYPILNHPGWDDERHCHNGLWDYCDNAGNRPVYEPLKTAIREFAGARQGTS